MEKGQHVVRAGAVGIAQRGTRPLTHRLPLLKGGLRGVVVALRVDDREGGSGAQHGHGERRVGAGPRGGQELVVRPPPPAPDLLHSSNTELRVIATSLPNDEYS